jgi:hypothetical protein
MNRLVEKVVVTNTTPYSSGDCVGGVIELDAGEPSSKDGDLLHMLTVIDKSNQKAALVLVLFDRNPVGATTADNGAFAWGTEIDHVVGVVAVASADYVTLDSKAVATISSVGCKFRGNGNSCYAVLVTSGTPTYAASALTLKFGLVLNT